MEAEIKAETLRIFDLHCDTLDALSMRGVEPFASQCGAAGLAPEDDLAHNSLQLAADRMAAAGQWCQCFAVWVPDDLSATGLTPHQFYNRATGYYKQQLAAHPELLYQVRDCRELSESGIASRGLFHAGPLSGSNITGDGAAKPTADTLSGIARRQVSQKDPQPIQGHEAHGGGIVLPWEVRSSDGNSSQHAPAAPGGTKSASRVAAILTVENASPLSDGIEVLDQMSTDGVKMMTLTWNGSNCIGSGNDTLEGLTSFGRKAIRRMEELGIVVDVSHLNDVGFKDVLACSTRPFVASHSNSRAVCGHPRNLTDYEFQAICDRGGLVGVNYYRSFISERYGDTGAAVPGREEVTFDELSFHIDRFLHLGGEKVIALGSDFDGSDTPAWLNGAQDIPAFYGMVAKRFSIDIADAMFWNNAASFFAHNEK